MTDSVETEVIASQELLVLDMELLVGVIKSNARVVAFREVDTGLKTLIDVLFTDLFLEIIIVLFEVYYDESDIVLTVVVCATLFSYELGNLA